MDKEVEQAAEKCRQKLQEMEELLVEWQKREGVPESMRAISVDSIKREITLIGKELARHDAEKK